MASLLSRWRKKRLIKFSLIKASPVLRIKEGEIAIVTYTSATDKMKVFAAFIREGLENGDLVNYIYSDEEGGTVRAKLKEHGIDVEKYERNGALILKSLTEFYMPDHGNFDKDRAIREELDARAEAKKKGYKHFRELGDVGDFSFLNGQWQKFLDYWDDPRWGSPGAGVGVLYEPFVMELTAINVEGISEAQARDILKAFGGGRNPPTRFIDLLEYADAFSKRVAITHERLLGHKFLLEFDPVSNYEKVVEDFAKEALANLDSTTIFTSGTSAVHACLAQQRAVKFFLMSVSTSTPEPTSENEILLPSGNIALMLDSINKVLETYAEGNVFLVFDILSELIELVGFEKTYRFLRYVLDMLSSTRATALFLINPSAHELQVISAIRELFHNLLTYEENKLTVVKIS